MAITFTQVPLSLQFDSLALDRVVQEVDSLIGKNPNKVFTIDTSIHVDSIEKANQVLAGLDTLRALGAIDQKNYSSAYHQIKRFKQLYMK